MTKAERGTRKYAKLLAKKEAADKKIKENAAAQKSGTSKKSTTQQQVENLAARNKSVRMQNRMNRVSNRRTPDASWKASNGANVYSGPDTEVVAPKKNPVNKQLSSSASKALEELKASRKKDTKK